MFLFASYCDWFAAGVYCSGPCACQGCFNRSEYEDIVCETREQIESRNPLAFAPKIVPLKPELPPNIVVLTLFLIIIFSFCIVIIVSSLLRVVWSYSKKLVMVQHRHRQDIKGGVTAKNQCAWKNTANATRFECRCYALHTLILCFLSIKSSYCLTLIKCILLFAKSNVGCSSGGRCEGCKNVYGRKEGSQYFLSTVY